MKWIVDLITSTHDIPHGLNWSCGWKELSRLLEPARGALQRPQNPTQTQEWEKRPNSELHRCRLVFEHDLRKTPGMLSAALYVIQKLAISPFVSQMDPTHALDLTQVPPNRGRSDEIFIKMCLTFSTSIRNESQLFKLCHCQISSKKFSPCTENRLTKRIQTRKKLACMEAVCFTCE